MLFPMDPQNNYCLSPDRKRQSFPAIQVQQINITLLPEGSGRDISLQAPAAAGIPPESAPLQQILPLPVHVILHDAGQGFLIFR